MAPIFVFFLILAGLAGFLGCLAFGAHVLDSKEAKNKVNKRELVSARQTLNEIEDIARAHLALDPNNITLQHVADVLRRHNRRVLNQ